MLEGKWRPPGVDYIMPEGTVYQDYICNPVGDEPLGANDATPAAPQQTLAQPSTLPPPIPQLGGAPVAADAQVASSSSSAAVAAPVPKEKGAGGSSSDGDAPRKRKKKPVVTDASATESADDEEDVPKPKSRPKSKSSSSGDESRPKDAAAPRKRSKPAAKPAGDTTSKPVDAPATEQRGEQGSGVVLVHGLDAGKHPLVAAQRPSSADIEAFRSSTTSDSRSLIAKYVVSITDTAASKGVDLGLQKLSGLCVTKSDVEDLVLHMSSYCYAILQAPFVAEEIAELRAARRPRRDPALQSSLKAVGKSLMPKNTETSDT